MSPAKSVPQPMCPHGSAGTVFGALMDVLNKGAHKFALRRLGVQPEDAVLEIGFGTGQLIRMLAARGGFVGGIDPSELMVRTAIKRNGRAIRKGRVDLRLGTASDLPWPAERFDKAAALHCFQFWADPEHDLQEVARVLKPGGLFLLVLRAHDGRQDVSWLPNPLSRSQDEIADLIAALQRCGFRDAKAEGATGSSPVVTAIRAS